MGGYPQPSVLAAEPPGGTCARGARGAGGARAPEAGFTLIELIVVISIIAALMGIGVAGYMAMGRGLSAEACLSSMEDTLRTARNFAIRSGSAGRVDIDTDARTMRAVGFKVVGLWHMEGPEGAFGLDLDIEEAEDVKGKIGRGVLFQGKGSYAYCGDVGDIHRQEGVYVEAWVFPMLSGQDQYIFRKKKDFELKLTRYGNLVGGRRDVQVEAEDYYLPIHRWAKIGLLVAPDRLQIFVDDILRAELDEGLKMPGGTEPFQISDPNEPFVGIVDEVRFLGLQRGRKLVIPGNYRIITGTKSVYFDGSGRLDSTHHGGELRVGFADETKQRMLTVGRSGLVRERTVAAAPPPAPAKPSPAAVRGPTVKAPPKAPRKKTRVEIIAEKILQKKPIDEIDFETEVPEKKPQPAKAPEEKAPVGKAPEEKAPGKEAPADAPGAGAKGGPDK